MCGAPQNTQPVQSALYHTESEDEHAPAPFDADEEEGDAEDYGPLDTPGVDNNGRDTPQEHGSPSFDYHEERRLHLKDEIYFSHRLPRLPPPAIPGASGSYDDKRSGPLSHSFHGGLDSMSASFHSAHSAAHSASMAGPSAGASPSAFHPTGPQYQMRNLSLDDGAPAHGAARAQAATYGQGPGPSTGQGYSQGRNDMASPGTYGNQEARPTLLHRKEMDSQERLDLQEERREKVLAEHPEQLRMSAMNQPQTQTQGTGPGAAQGQAGANSQPGHYAQDRRPSPSAALGLHLDPNLFLSRMFSPPGSPVNSRPSSPTGQNHGSSPLSPLSSPPLTPSTGTGHRPLQRALDSAFDLLSPFSPNYDADGERVDAGDVEAMNDLLTECHYYAFAENGIGNALDSLYASFAKCLDLRDKYLALSNQRLGDNPRDHDGAFKGFYPRAMGDVMGVKPEADPSTCEVPPYSMHADGFAADPAAHNVDGGGNGANAEGGKEGQELPAWKIYPPPPPPHWHWKPSTEGQAPKLEHRDSDAPFGADGAGENVQPGQQQQQQQQSTTTDSTDTTGSGPANGPYKTAGKPDMHVFNKDDCVIPGKDARWTFELDDEGVFQVYAKKEDGGDAADGAGATQQAPEQQQQQSKGKGKREKLARIPDLREYFTDLDYLLNVCSDGPAKSFAFRRLKYLASKWSLYCLLNEYQELADMKAVPHRDFYNVRKVDTHIHHSASMNQKHLLRFIKAKLKKSPHEIVIHRDGKDLTLAEVFESLNLTAYDLSIDTLDMHAHQEFHRFDRFNDRYNPTGSSRLREIFLKTDNLLKGKYLAELTQELITDLEQSKYQHCEWRLSIYGRNLQEWDKLAKWVVNNKLISHNVRWLIQVPRLYEVFKGGGLIKNFEDIVKNVFQPLFEVTADPSSHPELHIFLQRVVGFDSVDDESKPERRLYRKFPTARMWDTKQSPPYSYWIYYMYANMASLNAWRRERGFNTFVLRPHCGEAGDPDHLSSAFLTSHSIAHGILLRKVPALQYLFYLKQIGLAMSPLSNNALFLTYERNPFKDFFRVGLNVSLSTDDPLQFHFTQSHLLEEYSCAAQIYKLTPADMCELARNSVLQSGWEMAVKKHWIGHQWYLPGSAGNDIHKTNVPTSRLTYRHQTLLEELTLIRHGTHSPAATPTHLQSAAGTAPATGVPGLAPNGAAITSSPVQTFSRPAVPLYSNGTHTHAQSQQPGTTTTYHDGDIGAAAMAAGSRSVNDQVAAAAGSHGAGAGSSAIGQNDHSRQGSLHKQPSMSLGMSTVAGLPSASGQGVVTAGVGALDEAMHRKRAMSMGKKE